MNQSIVGFHVDEHGDWVAEGRDIEIFYQGRKVAPKTIESGAWMSFVPQGARAAGEDRQEESEGGAAR